MNLFTNRVSISVLFFSVVLALISCNGGGDPPPPNNPCTGVTVSVTATTTNPVGTSSNGSISASASGGSGFTFSINGGSFQSSGNFTGLAAGNHTITAKNSNGCTGSGSFTLTATNPCTGVTITVSGTTVNPTTPTSNNGSITLSTSGGTAPFTYSLNGGSSQSSNVFNNLGPGSYTVTATDANGCTGTGNFTLLNPCAGVTVTVNATTTNPTAPGATNGSIAATASGGTGTYTYSLNSGAPQSSGTFNNLGAGSYTVTATSANGCIGSASFTLTAPNPCAGVTITVNGTVTNPTSPGSSTGSIAASASGGTAPYTYSLNGGSFQASGTFNNLAAGTYSVTAKDANNCQGSANFTLTDPNPCAGVTINPNPTPTAHVPCSPNNGSITANASGGTGPYMYSLNSGPFQSGNTFSNLAPGTYSVTARDVNLCVGTTNSTVATAAAGPLFSQVRTLLQNNCAVSGCHNGPQSPNFTVDCNIVSNWDRIQARAVNGNPSFMPPTGALPASDRQKITDWINAGHGYNH